MTDLRTWVRYTKRCAPAGTPAARTATVDGGATSPSLTPEDEPRRRRRRPPRPPQRASKGGVESGHEETGDWEEDYSGSGGGGFGFGGEDLVEAADLTAGLEGGGGEGGGERRRRAEASGLEPEGEWPDVGERDGGGKAAAEDVDSVELPGGSRWWQKLQPFVGGAGTGSRQQQRHHRDQWVEKQQQQQAEWEELEELGGDNDDDGAQEDELIGNVHFGFCEYYQTLVAEGLADTISRLARENPSYSILVTGHSLGAAAAAVCAADLVQRLGIERDRVVLYTLGEPRTGDGIFAEGVNDRVVRIFRRVWGVWRGRERERAPPSW